MDAVPPDLSPDRDHLTGLVCPDCEGVLQAKVVGRREHLQFTCRIGHTYALGELIVAREVDLEHRAWAAVHAAEEMDTRASRRLPGRHRGRSAGALAGRRRHGTWRFRSR
jgi:hypothetical protein